MIRTRSFLLSATAAVFMLVVAAPASFAATTVEPAGQTMTGVGANGFSLTVESGEQFVCSGSQIKAKVPAKPNNTAASGPVVLTTVGPEIWSCIVKTGVGNFTSNWTITSAKGPWSLGAEVTATETLLNLRTSPSGLVVHVPAIGCTVTFFPNGDEMVGKFTKATSTVQYNGPASYDGSQCGALGSGNAVFKADYQFKGLTIS